MVSDKERLLRMHEAGSLRAWLYAENSSNPYATTADYIFHLENLPDGSRELVDTVNDARMFGEILSILYSKGHDRESVAQWLAELGLHRSLVDGWVKRWPAVDNADMPAKEEV